MAGKGDGWVREGESFFSRDAGLEAHKDSHTTRRLSRETSSAENLHLGF